MAKTRTHRALRAVAALGLIFSGGVAAAQHTAHAAGPVTIHFWMGADNSGTDPKLVALFNKMNAGKIKVILDPQSTSTDTYFNTVKRALQAKSTTPDVFGGDVIWPAQLASLGVLLPIDKYFPMADRAKYLAGAIADPQYKGQMVGAPWFTDYGLIYYRKDLLAKYKMAVPTTWEQMQQEAVTLVKKGAVKEGFVFQGNQYEGLVCDALEYIHGAGGAIYGPDAAKTTAQAAKGLATMRSMITSGASPQAVTTYQEETGSGPDFRNGLAAFLRNWNYNWGLSQSASSKVAGKVGVTAMLHEPGQTGYSTLGGWNLFISKYSQHPNEAWQFVKFMIGPTAQSMKAIGGGNAVVLRSTYSDPQVLKANPYFKTLIPVLQIKTRPVSPVYNDISLKMQQDFHSVLTGDMAPDAAVKDIEGFIAVAEARFH